MGRIKTLLSVALVLIFTAAPSLWARSPAGPPKAESQEAVLVGRIAHVQGQLLRYVPEDKDWVATVKDAPFGLDDALYSSDDAKAEFLMPNSTWLRVGGDTQVQMITLKDDVTEIDVASGIARFFNRSSDGVIKATTPFGYVTAQGGTVFDLYVGDESVEVLSLKGTVDFITDTDHSKYEVRAGSSSIVADGRRVTSGEGTVDADWDNWNAERDRSWNKRLQVKGDSVKYLPSQLHDDAYELEENGRWERVHYEGEYRQFWRPTTVAVGWSPFTVGRWSEWYGDNCWVPYEPFGYVTHHYGNWVYAGSSWYWSPPIAAPVVRVGVAAPLPVWGIGFGWYPGRVGWIHSGVDIGWVPLAPTEVYYGRRYWGPRAMVVNQVNITNIRINNYRYVDRAVVINKSNLYTVNGYGGVRVTNINRTTIINNYRPAPVINNTVINNYNTNRNRYAYSDVVVNRKPHQEVVSRIERNEKLAGQQSRVRAADIETNVAKMKPGTVESGAPVKAPKVTNKMVPAGDVNKPKNAVSFEQKDLKKNAKPAVGITDDRLPGSSGRPGADNQGRDKPGRGDDQGRPGKPDDLGKPGRPDDSGRPGRPDRPPRPDKAGRPDMPGVDEKSDGRVKPGKPGKPGQEDLPGEGGRGDRVRPPRPGQDVLPADETRPGRQGKPGKAGDDAMGDRVRPPRSGQDVLPAEETRPGRQGRPGKAGDDATGDRVRPPRPGRDAQPGDDNARPGRPGRDAQSGQDNTRPGRHVQPGADDNAGSQRMKPPRQGDGSPARMEDQGARGEGRRQRQPDFATQDERRQNPGRDGGRQPRDQGQQKDLARPQRDQGQGRDVTLPHRDQGQAGARPDQPRRQMMEEPGRKQQRDQGEQPGQGEKKKKKQQDEMMGY